jgi:hypothetical protein
LARHALPLAVPSNPGIGKTTEPRKSLSFIFCLTLVFSDRNGNIAVQVNHHLTVSKKLNMIARGPECLRPLDDLEFSGSHAGVQIATDLGVGDLPHSAPKPVAYRRAFIDDGDAGLHAMRHTFLTEAGEYTDPFTLQYVAGHDNIKTAMRYVHPRESALHRLFAWLADLQRPEDRIACTEAVENPLIISNLQSAEVVELADTPS